MLMMLVGTVIGLTIYFALTYLSHAFFNLDAPFSIVLPPQSAIWFFLPFFTGLTMCWEATLWLWSLFAGKQEPALYEYWSNTKAGYDATLVLRGFGIFIGLPIAILTALALPQHVVLRDQDILVRDYGFFGARTYNYNRARTMTIIKGLRGRTQKFTKRAGIVLDFDDGRRWSSGDFGDFLPNVDPKLLSFLENKTGLQPRFAEAREDLPAPLAH